jgi:hypothetical protein
MACTGFTAGTGDITLENAQTIDGGTNNSVILGDNSDTLNIAFDGNDVSLTCNDGSIELVPEASAADGTIDFLGGGDTSDYIRVITDVADTPRLDWVGCDALITAAGGDISFDNENLLTSGTLGAGAITGTSFIVGDDVIDVVVDDILRFASNDGISTIEAYGFEASKDEGDNNADTWQIVSEATTNSFVIKNDTSGSQAAIWTLTSAGAITQAGDFTVSGTTPTITIGDGGTEDNRLQFDGVEDFYIAQDDTGGQAEDIMTIGYGNVVGTTPILSFNATQQMILEEGELFYNTTDDTVVIASDDGDPILEIYSPNTSNGDASLELAGDAKADATDRWRIVNDTGLGSIGFKCDQSVAGTFVTVLAIAGADGDITTTGDIEIGDDFDLVLGANADVFFQYDEAVDDQLIIGLAGTTCTADTDPMFEILAEVGTANGTGMDDEQQIFGVAKGTQASNVALFTIDEDGDVAVTSDLTVTGLDIFLGATGVKITSDNDGAITFLGASAGADEDLTINLDDVADEITFSTSTSATLIDLDGALDLEISGNDLTLGEAGVKFTSDADGAFTMLGLGDGDDEDLKLNFDDTANEVSITSSTGVVLIDIEGAIDLAVAGGDFTMQSATASKPVIWLENIADDATGGSIILENDRATEADGDDCGTIIFRASDTGDATFDAVTILCEATDVTPAAEAGKITIDVEIADVATEMLSMYGTAAGTTGGIYFNQDEADVDFIVSGNTTAGYLTIDATVESTTLSSSITVQPELSLTNTNTDANCAVLSFRKDGEDEADGDDLGRINFYGNDDGNADQVFAYILVESNEIDATDEAGKVSFQIEVNDTDTAFLGMFGDTTDVDTAHFEINSGAADIDFHLDGNDQADLIFVEADTDTINFNVGQADSRFIINQDAVAGTEGASLVLIDDERTGATANSAAEASLMIDPQGTHAINVVDGISYFGGAVQFGGGQTRKARVPMDHITLDSANPPTLTFNGTAAQMEIESLEFDANPNATGDDICYIQWVVPDGYVVDSAALNVYWSHDTAEDLADECVIDGEVNAVAAGEAIDAAGTACAAVTSVIADATASAGTLVKTVLDIEVETIAVGDLVTIKFFFDESACLMAASGTADVHWFELEWESTE